MKSKPKKEYEVGYGKPPVATRFKEGRSGNPNRRPPKKFAQELNPGKILQLVDNEEIVVKINGKRKSMPKAEIYFRQLFTKAIKGDLTAAILIAKKPDRQISRIRLSDKTSRLRPRHVAPGRAILRTGS